MIIVIIERLLFIFLLKLLLLIRIFLYNYLYFICVLTFAIIIDVVLFIKWDRLSFLNMVSRIILNQSLRTCTYHPIIILQLLLLLSQVTLVIWLNNTTLSISTRCYNTLFIGLLLLLLVVKFRSRRVVRVRILGYQRLIDLL